MSPIIACNLAAFTIALVFYAWRDVYMRWRMNRRMLRERVAYMLWVAANR
jgi:hypothetical protein